MDFADDFKIYCCKDSFGTLLASKELRKELEELHLTEFYHKIVNPLAELIVRLNLRGLPVDEQKMEAAVSGLTKEIAVIREEIAFMAGKPLEPGTKEFKQFLYNDLGLSEGKKSKQGIGKADKATLKRLRNENPELAPFFNKILGLRQREKLVSTFLAKDQVDQETWRLYPNFKIGPATGRLACKKPNFQNYPEGLVRDVFMAKKGWKFVYADYSQLEARIFAVLAGATQLLEDFRLGRDIHDENARALFNIKPEDKPNALHRDQAKVFFYMYMYGGDPTNLVGRGSILGDVSAESFRQTSGGFIKRHPQIPAFREKIKSQLFSKRRLVNAFGRPRIFFGNPKDAIHSAYNFPMQSGASDLMNTRLIELDFLIPDSLVLQVHDSVMFEVRDEEVEDVKGVVKEVLERESPEFNGYKFPAEVKVGESWGEM